MKKPKHIFLKFIGYAFKAYKIYFFVLIFHALCTAFTTILGAYTLSLILQAIETNSFSKGVYYIGFLVGAEVILALLNLFSKRLIDIHQPKMTEAIDHMMAEKILSLPFSCLEDPYYLELKKNVQMGISNMGAIHSLLVSLTTIASRVLSLIGLGVIIARFDPVLIAVLFIGIILNVIFILISMKVQVNIYKSLLPINFKYGYYMSALMSTENCKDLRLYSTHALLYQNFKCFSKLVEKNLTSAQMKMGVFQSIISSVRYIQMAAVYILSGVRTIRLKLPISSFSLTISSAISFSDCMTEIISAGSNYIQSIEYITPLIELMEIKEETNPGKKEINQIQSIRFDHVYFKYPKADHYVLEDVTFEIKAFEKISIVGLNGAGKTTIIKLLCQLYPVTQGKILINNTSIEEFDKESYLSLLSAVFQDYKLFAYSIKDNISKDLSLTEIKTICQKVGIGEKVDELPKQYDSCLSKSYEDDAVELSGGQRQKIAIARSLAKNANLLILDEPTSALDPLAEAEIYENFNSLTLNKTAIYISHRMSSSIFCDRILVLDGGKVSDFDTHENLMKKDCLYKRLFDLQSHNYEIIEN